MVITPTVRHPHAQVAQRRPVAFGGGKACAVAVPVGADGAALRFQDFYVPPTQTRAHHLATAHEIDEGAAQRAVGEEFLVSALALLAPDDVVANRHV